MKKNLLSPLWDTNRKKYWIILLGLTLFSFFNVFGQSKSRQGSYKVIGKAFYKSQPLTNSIITINERKVLTDSLGNYEFIVKWVAVEKQPFFIRIFRNWEKKLNPKFINFTYKENKLRIKNEWKKYLQDSAMILNNNLLF